jgi:hypothetical protein
MKADKFTLTIDMGNAAMRSTDDVARYLRKLAGKIDHECRTEGKVMDENGNSCGEWAFDCGDAPVNAARTLSKAALLDSASEALELGTCDEDD